MGGKNSKTSKVKTTNPPASGNANTSPVGSNTQSNEEEKIDHIFKICIIGDSNVGKTSILLRFVEDKFVPDLKVKTNEEYLTKIIDHKGDKIKLIIVSNCLVHLVG
jgi:GTPase SAR1 family protein